MTIERFAFGDRVRHSKRPEWGIGSVVKAEDLPVNGQRSQRVSIRFPGVGVKALMTSAVTLQRVMDEASVEPDVDDESAVSRWDRVGESDWLAPVAARKIEEAMISLPAEATDPFVAVRERVEFTLGLYRFGRDGGSLVDWAVAQTGLDDPLSRFSRHELEHFFDRWAFERDAHFGRLVQEAGGARFQVDDLIAAAPRAVREAVRRAR